MGEIEVFRCRCDDDGNRAGSQPVSVTKVEGRGAILEQDAARTSGDESFASLASSLPGLVVCVVAPGEACAVVNLAVGAGPLPVGEGPKGPRGRRLRAPSPPARGAAARRASSAPPLRRCATEGAAVSGAGSEARAPGCRECGGPIGAPPGGNSRRPEDLCRSCWRRQRDRERYHERRARDPQWGRAVSARIWARQKERLASDPEYQESERVRRQAYMRDYMRDYRSRPPSPPSAEAVRRANRRHVVDLKEAGGLTRAVCSCGWHGRARRAREDAVATAERHFRRMGGGRIVGQSNRARTRRALRAEGRCVDCGEWFGGPETRCPRCREERNAREREEAAQLVADGLCRRKCGRQALPGRTRCAECLAQAAADAAARRRRQREGRGGR